MNIAEIFECFEKAPFTQDQIRRLYSKTVRIIGDISEDVIKKAIFNGCTRITICDDIVFLQNGDNEAVGDSHLSSEIDFNDILPEVYSVEINIPLKIFIIEFREGKFDFENELFCEKISAFFNDNLKVSAPYIVIPVAELEP